MQCSLSRPVFAGLALLLCVATRLCAAGEPDRDISCEATGQYTGNLIELDFWVSIAGPEVRKWAYTCTHNLLGKSDWRGTYVLEDDLAVFTGSLLPAKAKAVCFGLNFGFHDGDVEFDRFFPVEGKDKVFRYHRKWYERRGDGWQPVEEVLLTLSGEIPDGETWEVKMHGTRTTWEKNGKAVAENRSGVIVYRRVGHLGGKVEYGIYSAEERTTTWFPTYLGAFFKDGHLLSIRRAAAGLGVIRGFHPGKARDGRTREETSVGLDTTHGGTAARSAEPPLADGRGEPRR